MTTNGSFPALFGDTVPDEPLSRTNPSGQRSGTKRKIKSAKDRYLEAEARARSLREKLEERRAQNRNLFIEELFHRFDIAHIDGDFDEAERIETLRARISETGARST